MTTLVAIGYRAMEALALAEDLLAMAIMPEVRPRTRMLALHGGSEAPRFPGPVQWLDAAVPAAWDLAPWARPASLDDPWKRAIRQADADWNRLLASSPPPIHFVVADDAPERTVVPELGQWARSAGRTVIETWLGEGPLHARQTEDGISAACLLVMDVLNGPDNPLPPGT